MGNLFTGPKKPTTTTNTPPVTYTSPFRDPIPRNQNEPIKPVVNAEEKQSTKEKSEGNESPEIVDDKSKFPEDSKGFPDDFEPPMTNLKPPLTNKQKEALLRHGLDQNDEYTLYDFGIKEKCDDDPCKKNEKICKSDPASDSDDEKEPCVHKKKPCIKEKKEKKPCVEESEDDICEEIPMKQYHVNNICKKEIKQPCNEQLIDPIQTEASNMKMERSVQPPCTKDSMPKTAVVSPPPPSSNASAVSFSKGKEDSVSGSCPGTKKAGNGKSIGSKVPSGFGDMGAQEGRMIGDYPIEYNAKVHGPYDPARYYGKPDTPFGQVKLGELTTWLGRRNKHPQAIVSAFSRAHWRWQHKYLFPKKATFAPFIQFMTALMIFSYSINRYKIQYHQHYKYH